MPTGFRHAARLAVCRRVQGKVRWHAAQGMVICRRDDAMPRGAAQAGRLKRLCLRFARF